MRQKQFYPCSWCCGIHLLMGEGHHYGRARGREILGHGWRRQSHTFILLKTVVVCLIWRFPRCPMQGTHGCHQHGTSGRETFPCRLYRKGQNLCFHVCQIPDAKKASYRESSPDPRSCLKKILFIYMCKKKVKSHYWQSNFNQLETKLTATLVGLYNVT